jgi:hypothetical protein
LSLVFIEANFNPAREVLERMNAILAASVTVLLLSGCAQVPESPSSAGEQESFSPSPTTRNVDGCSVTVPPRPGFVPPEPYPPEPPFEQAWYGTPKLWTLLDSNGAVWRDLPVGKGPHAVGDKTLWFSENFSTAEGEDFSGEAEITLRAVDLDGSASEVVQQGGVPSFNRDIKNFMLVGLGLPEPGCWEVTATYKDAELSYTFLVKD